MTTYDWIVIGGGITGSALAYELGKQGLKVLLLEKEAQANNATFYTCLLYTSPSPRDLSTSRMPSSA